MGKYSKVASDAPQKIQINAGILLTQFEPDTASYSEEDIFGVTSGGIKIDCVPTYKDFGEDMDNMPKGSKELKQIESWECKASGTFITVDSETAKKLFGAADVSGNKVTPRFTLMSEDFFDVWFVGDYSDQNGEKNGGYIAVKLKNALSNGGMSMQTTDREKGQFSFEFLGHTSILEPDVVPCEFYVKAGTPEE